MDTIARPVAARSLAQKRFDFGPSSFGGELQIIPLSFHDEVLKSSAAAAGQPRSSKPNSFCYRQVARKAKSIALHALAPGAWPWL